MLWDKNKTNKNKMKTFNVRLNSDLQDKIEFLQERKGLNKSNIIRLALCDLYNTEIAKLKWKMVLWCIKMVKDYTICVRMDYMDYFFLDQLEGYLLAKNRSDTIRQLIRYKIEEYNKAERGE